MSKNNLASMSNPNMNKNQFIQSSKLLNTIYNNYSYLTLEDYNRIDEIDNKIFDIDKQLYFILTGERMKEDANIQKTEDVQQNNEKQMIISNIIQKVKENTPNPYLKFVSNMKKTLGKALAAISEQQSATELLLKRKSLVSERDEIINFNPHSSHEE